MNQVAKGGHSFDVDLFDDALKRAAKVAIGNPNPITV
jgi:hypothetical protein